MALVSLPGDRYSEEECIKLAKKVECPASNICRYCGKEIKIMAYTMTGSCSLNHEKLRYNPAAFSHVPNEKDYLLPLRKRIVKNQKKKK